MPAKCKGLYDFFQRSAQRCLEILFRCSLKVIRCRHPLAFGKAVDSRSTSPQTLRKETTGSRGPLTSCLLEWSNSDFPGTLPILSPSPMSEWSEFFDGPV